MKKLIALLLLCIVISPIRLAEASSDGVITIQERILTLPQDQTTWYLSLFGDTNDPMFQELKAWVDTNEGLASLKRQTHYNEYTTDQVRYNRYAESMPGLPCIRIQSGQGVIISEFWNSYIPMTSEALFQAICGDISDKTSWGRLRRRRDRCKPSPEPNPEPQPQPQPQPLPIGPPDLPIGPPVLVQPEPEPKETGFPWFLTALSALLGGSFGFVQSYKKEHMDKSSPSISKL